MKGYVAAWATTTFCLFMGIALWRWLANMQPVFLPRGPDLPSALLFCAFGGVFGAIAYGMHKDGVFK